MSAPLALKVLRGALGQPGLKAIRVMLGQLARRVIKVTKETLAQRALKERKARLLVFPTNSAPRLLMRILVLDLCASTMRLSGLSLNCMSMTKRKAAPMYRRGWGLLTILLALLTVF
jgi:hypothetical protein